MTMHTPGPWRWSDRYESSNGSETWSLLGDDGFGILSCDGKANSPQEVNMHDATLIAAAPDLLAALKLALPLLKGHQETRERKARYEAAIAAISKAGGAA